MGVGQSPVARRDNLPISVCNCYVAPEALNRNYTRAPSIPPFRATDWEDPNLLSGHDVECRSMYVTRKVSSTRYLCHCSSLLAGDRWASKHHPAVSKNTEIEKEWLAYARTTHGWRHQQLYTSYCIGRLAALERIRIPRISTSQGTALVSRFSIVLEWSAWIKGFKALANLLSIRIKKPEARSPDNRKSNIPYPEVYQELGRTQ
jgi:hypothetical protein